MLGRLARITLLTSILALAAAIGAAGTPGNESDWVPNLGWVNDSAGVLTRAQQQRLASTLEQYQQETHH